MTFEFEDVSDLVKEEPVNPDTIYLPLDDYYNLLKNVNFTTASGKGTIGRIAGLEVVVVEGIDESFVLPARGFPKAKHFKEHNV